MLQLIQLVLFQPDQFKSYCYGHIVYYICYTILYSIYILLDWSELAYRVYNYSARRSLSYLRLFNILGRRQLCFDRIQSYRRYYTGYELSIQSCVHSPVGGARLGDTELVVTIEESDDVHGLFYFVEGSESFSLQESGENATQPSSATLVVIRDKGMMEHVYIMVSRL